MTDLKLPIAIFFLGAVLLYYGVQAYKLFDNRIADEIRRAAVRG